MQKITKRYEIASWIAKEITKTLSTTEANQLKAWLDASPQHVNEYDHIRQRLLKDIEQPALELKQEWKLFKQKNHYRRLFIRFKYIAAACIVVSLMITGLWIYNQPTEKQIVTTENSNGTKEFKAVLILGNGQEVNIGDTIDQIIAIREGLQITNTGNIVKYDVQDCSKNTKTEWNTIKIPRGGEYELILADGTRVWLNSESQLTYPIRFTDKQREVKMSGEVCFDVTRNEEQPFVVKTGTTEVKVLGTLFNIEAYPETERITTTLVEGKIEVITPQHKQILSPNQQLLIQGEEITVKKVVATDYIGWITGLFHFTEASLEEIMTKLARWYNIEFFFSKSYLKEAHFTLDIYRYENIASILTKIEKTGRVKFRIQGKTVVIYE